MGKPVPALIGLPTICVLQRFVWRVASCVQAD